jgi:CheY-like chemotaxis protein
MPDLVGKILLVEDNPTNMRLLECFLKPLGHTIYQAINGKMALEMIELYKDTIDIIVLDLQMPDISGFEIIKSLKNDPDTAKIPIIISSAHAMDEDIDKVKALNCDAIMTKPINIDLFEKTINDLLEANS